MIENPNKYLCDLELISMFNLFQTLIDSDNINDWGMARYTEVCAEIESRGIKDKNNLN